MAEQYMVPKEIKSGIYFGKGVYLFDLAFVAGYWFVFSNLEFLIYEPLRIVYTIFNVLVAIYITRPVNSNPGKRRIHRMAFLLTERKNSIYHMRETAHEKEIKYIG